MTLRVTVLGSALAAALLALLVATSAFAQTPGPGFEPGGGWGPGGMMGGFGASVLGTRHRRHRSARGARSRAQPVARGSEPAGERRIRR